MPDWKKIRAEYVRGGGSYRSLCKKYDVPLHKLRSVAAKEDWVRLKEQAKHKASTKIVDMAAERIAGKEDMIQTAADRLLIKITEGLEDGTLALNAQSIKQLTGAIRDLKEIKGIKPDETKTINVVFGSPELEEWSE